MEEINEAEYLAEEMNDPYAYRDNPDYKGGWGEGDNDGWDGYGEDAPPDHSDWDEE